MKRGCLMRGRLAVEAAVALAVFLNIGFGAIDGKSPDKVLVKLVRLGFLTTLPANLRL